MISRIYLKLVRYFIALILTTCLTSMILFFLSIGYPMAKDLHGLLRNHSKYISYLTGGMLDRGASEDELNRFFNKTAESYNTGIILLTSDLKRVAWASVPETGTVTVTDEMLSDVKEKGLYVQSSHFGKPLVYILPIGDTHYIVIYKSYKRLKRALVFTAGIVVMCGLLILAIYPLSKGFTKPLMSLSDAFKQISAGNFTASVNIGTRNDELGDLLKEFQRMRQSIDDMIESRKVLLADISHELRSPLGRLSIAAELLKDSSDVEDKKKYLDSIDYEINYMNVLLRQLTLYSTLNLPETGLVKAIISTADLISDVSGRYKPVMEKEGMVFETHQKDGGMLIHADRDKITQVINNLIDNAMNACYENGSIRLTCTESGSMVDFAISNTGPEIPETLQEKVFEPLFRADPSRTKKTGGAGLGLSISKKIIELHEGSISCFSKDGVTTFSFSLKQGTEF